MISVTSDSSRFTRYGDLLVAVFIVFSVMMMIIPLPASLLSFLLIINITLSLLILLVALFTQEVLDFSVFPALLLVMTLFRLCLNISTTRLILLHAYAGEVIQKFGGFVIGNNPVVGFIIFLILVVIQFIVITKGAERVSEVAARFTLDAMPGKQMSIDADLSAGLISENEAKDRRAKIQQEADFYGAMDGASKFVRGDAIAAIVIVVINIVGGFLIGLVQKGMDFQQALQTYTVLTVGDGLVTQIPALLVSTSAGIIVTRAAADSTFGIDLTKQLFSYPRAMAIAGGLLLFLGVCGLPFMPILIISGTLFGMSYLLNRSLVNARIEEEERIRAREFEEAKKPEHVFSLVQVDPLEVELGYNLLPLVDEKQEGDLLDRIVLIRRQIALDFGFIVPPIRLRDNMQLSPNDYVIKVKGVEVGKGNLVLNHCLVLGPDVQEKMEGIKTTDPTFGLPALWIPVSRKEEAELTGYTVVDTISVLATHLTEIIKKYAHEILSRQDVQNLLDHTKKTSPAVVNELYPELLNLGEIQKVLGNLLREGVAIRDLVTILEALSDAARVTKVPELLTEYVRQSMGRQIVAPYLVDYKLFVLTLDPELDQVIKDGIQQTEQGSFLALEPQTTQKLLSRLVDWTGRVMNAGHQPVVLCSPVVRFHLKRLTEKMIPNLIVLSYNEILPDINVESLGMVSIDEN
ncbi:MAG: flagellar biosynthesis protein FlhA [Thermacetogeniaceae bacterium]|jgi:flagellar biosynthesis protein FlhA|nr:flagellar biosynthesis protein FlhA [Thermoanaerobacterales bacterium]